jgi:hypothetical protein
LTSLCGFDPNWENTENLAQHVRNIQERETREVDEKEVYISEKQKSDKDLTLIRPCQLSFGILEV